MFGSIWRSQLWTWTLVSGSTTTSPFTVMEIFVRSSIGTSSSLTSEMKLENSEWTKLKIWSYEDNEKKWVLKNSGNMPQNVADGEDRAVKHHVDPTSKHWELKTEHSRAPTECERCPWDKMCMLWGQHGQDPVPTAPKHWLGARHRPERAELHSYIQGNERKNLNESFNPSNKENQVGSRRCCFGPIIEDN